MTTLGVLDQSPLRHGATATDAVHDTLALAKAADRLGYSRYWLAEHHNTGGLASAAPEVLIGAVASQTSRIRVGSGGVMLTHYSPLHVAEQFRMLEALHPGRIDLGVGRAPGSDTKTDRALAAGPGKLPLDDYPDQLVDLYGYLSGTIPAEHEFSGIKAMPEGPTMPELWLLGSSSASALYAAELGWKFCFAHFINQEGGDRFLQMYRDRFQPSPFLEAPVASAGISATVAETREEAERLSWSRWGWRLMARQGGRRGIPTPEEAMAFDYTPAERDYLEYAKSRSIYGTGEEVRDRILALGREFAVDEFIVVTITHDFQSRLRSYELLARAFGLPGAA